MEVKHCGNLLSPVRERVIKATSDETCRGVIELLTQEYYCADTRCRKRLFYKKEIYATGQSEWARVRPHQQAVFVKRLRMAKESDWVWGFSPITYGKIKVTVE
jgi:hypothetical protein